jgi:hypothetical protein
MRKANTSNRPSIYQTVTDRIISSLKAGVIPWEKPWNTPRFAGGPLVSPARAEPVLCAMFDEVFGTLAYMAARRPAVTIEMSTSFLRPFQPEHKMLTVRADLVSASRSLLVLEAKATRPDGKLAAISKVQMLHIDRNVE